MSAPDFVVADAGALKDLANRMLRERLCAAIAAEREMIAEVLALYTSRAPVGDCRESPRVPARTPAVTP